MQFIVDRSFKLLFHLIQFLFVSFVSLFETKVWSVRTLVCVLVITFVLRSLLVKIALSNLVENPHQGPTGYKGYNGQQGPMGGDGPKGKQGDDGTRGLNGLQVRVQLEQCTNLECSF